ncbi:hypothetical protein D3C76_1044430 [compost metagenome]
MEPIFIDFGFDISVLLLLFGHKRAFGVSQLLFTLILCSLNIARNTYQILTQCLNIGEQHLKQAEAFFRMNQTGNIERPLLRMQKLAADLIAELPHQFTRELLLRFNIFLSGTSQESLLQLCIHVHDLRFHHIHIA